MADDRKTKSVGKIFKIKLQLTTLYIQLNKFNHL